MPEVAFVISRAQPRSLRELAATLEYELGQQGIPASLHVGGFPEQRPGRVYALLDPWSYAESEGERALPDDAVLKRTVFLCSEPVDSGPDQRYIELLERAGAVFVPDSRSRVNAVRQGVRAWVLRPGYSKSRDRFDPDAARPLDVAFIGEQSPRRTRYLSAAARMLSRHERLLEIAESGRPEEEPDRLQLLTQAKILLSLHRDDDDPRFEWQLALDAIHAGAVVVTEHSTGIAPLVPGEHLLAASADSLPFVLDALLRDERRLASLRAQAYERVRDWVPFALPVSVLRAAVVELVGEPLDAAASRGRTREPAA